MRNVLIVVGLLCISLGMACGSNIPLVNGSFESPVISGEYEEGASPTGWLAINSISTIMEVTARCEPFGMTNNPDGAQFYRNYDNTFNDSSFIYQNTGVQIQAGVTYSLSAYMNAVGQTATYLLLGGSDTPSGVVDTTVWVDPTKTPADYPNLRCEPGGVWVGDLSDWQQFTFSLNVQSGDPLVGKYLCPAIRTVIGWVAYDKVTLTSDGVNVSGTVTLSDYSGDTSLCPVRVELKQDGNVRYTTEIRPATATSAPFGLYAIAPGTYDLSLSAGKWLSKTVSVEVGTADVTGIDVTLINGDSNGSNSITSDDPAVTIKSLDQKGY